MERELEEQMVYEAHGVEKMNIDISYDNSYENNQIHCFLVGYRSKHAHVIHFWE